MATDPAAVMILLPSSRRLRAALAVLLLAICDGGSRAQSQAPAAGFAGQISSLSEAAGYFDTDNLISNEQGYLGVVQDIERAGLRGGAYVGVGPDQNFSYIAAARPDVAFIIDVRRDNLLLHLLFKGLFALSRTRVEYLSLLCGRDVPKEIESWRAKNVEALTGYVDAAPPLDRTAIDGLRARVTEKVRSFGVSLSPTELETIDRFHRRFIEAALGLRFQSLGRPAQLHYPTFRQLLLEVDAGGHQRNYLATEDAFQFVKSLEARDLVIPVVGNLSGDSAMVAIARWLRTHDTRLSLFYASNVEFYLFRDGSFPRFVENLSKMPHGDHALIIRSVFGGGGGFGGGSVSETQAVPELLEGFSRGKYHQYWELVR